MLEPSARDWASLQTIKDQFGSKLCCNIKEEPSVARSCPVDITFSESSTRILDLEVIHTPGHTDGSVSFVYRSPLGHTYLFTGDTFFQSNRSWGTFVMPQAGGSQKSLIESLNLYRNLNPDVVISSGSNMGSDPFVELTTAEWIDAIDNAIRELQN